jgi:hypothetical protein
MASYLTQYKYAKLLGVSKQAVNWAVKDGRVVLTERGIDPEHIVNLQFAANAKLRSKEVKTGTIRNRKKREKKEAEKKRIEIQTEKDLEEEEQKEIAKKEQKKTEEKIPTLDELDEKYQKIKRSIGPGHGWQQQRNDEPDPETVDINSLPFDDPRRKNYEETRLKKIKADTLALEYGEKLKLLIDENSLTKKFGKFFDFIINQLIYMPEEASDMLWNKAKSAHDPVKALEEELKDRIRDIVDKAKRAAANVIPEKSKGSRYVLLDMISKTEDEYEETEKKTAV